jgi:cyclase
MLKTVQATAENVFVPLTVGGGVRSVSDMRAVLRAGADKVALNSAAVQQPRLVTDCAAAFGSQCVVVATEGYDIRLLSAIRRRVSIPAIASGGAGDPSDLVEAIVEGGADAVLAASIFHRSIHSIAQVKIDLALAGVPVREM